MAPAKEKRQPSRRLIYFGVKMASEEQHTSPAKSVPKACRESSIIEPVEYTFDMNRDNKLDKYSEHALITQKRLKPL